MVEKRLLIACWHRHKQQAAARARLAAGAGARYPQLAALHTRIIRRARAARTARTAHDCTTDSANKFICTQIVSALAIKTLLALGLR